VKRNLVGKKPWDLMDSLLQEVTRAPSDETLAICRALVPLGSQPDEAHFKQQADTEYVTIYKDRNKESTKRARTQEITPELSGLEMVGAPCLFLSLSKANLSLCCRPPGPCSPVRLFAGMVIKRTKRMEFSPELVWKSGQSAEFMSKLDKNVKDVQIQKFDDECDIVYWKINLPPGISNRDFCVMRLLRAQPEIQSYETLLVSAVHPDFPEKKGVTRAFIFAYSNVQAALDAPLDAKGVPTAATNLSLGFTDVKGAIPPKLMEKMMYVQHTTRTPLQCLGPGVCLQFLR
jgi:hypothetical protein